MRRTGRAAPALAAALVLAGCGRRTAAPPSTDALRAGWLDRIARAKFGPDAKPARSGCWQGVRITFTSSRKAPGMRREWILLLPVRGQPRPEVLGDIYGAMVLRPEHRSGMGGNPSCERLSPGTAREILGWGNKSRLLSGEEALLAKLAPLLFGKPLEAVRADGRLGEFTAEQLGEVHEHVFELNIQAGAEEDYVPQEGTMILDRDGVVLWHGISAVLTISR